MGKAQKLNQVLRNILHKPVHDDSENSGSARRLSISSGFSRESSQRSTWSRSGRLSSRASDSAKSSANFDFDCDCGNECCSSPPQDVPTGCLPVYVGEERRRFVIPTSYLTNNTFQALLAKSEEEYGLRCEGGLRIACPPDAFEHLLWSLQGDTTFDWDAIERSS